MAQSLFDVRRSPFAFIGIWEPRPVPAQRAKTQEVLNFRQAALRGGAFPAFFFDKIASMADNERSAIRTLTIRRKTMLPALEEFLMEFFARVLGKKKKEELPLVITARPVRIAGIWGRSGNFRRRSFFLSLVTHGITIVLFLTIFQAPVRRTSHKIDSTISFVKVPPYRVQAKPPSGKEGGGGGGDRSPLPPSKGRLPKAAPRQFTPPTAVIQNLNPKLMMEPTLVIPPDIKLPNVDMPNYGYPFGKIGPLSSGPGSGGGIGTGSGGGVGPGKGPGFGPGEGGGFGGGVYRIGGGISAPQLLYKVEPEYSEEARKAKHQGTVLLTAIVDVDGKAKDIKVTRSLGLSLDEKAIEAIKKWRFKPGVKDGKPVATYVAIEVNFRLL